MDAEARKRRLIDWALPKIRTEPASLRASLYRAVADLAPETERNQLIALADKLESIEHETRSFEFLRNPNQP